MVFLAMTRLGYEAYVSLKSRAPLWVADGVLTPKELDELRAIGLSVTNFTRKIDFADPEELADAISTIREHHPGEPIWVEGIES